MQDESSAPVVSGPAAPVDVESLVLSASRAAVATMAPEELEVFDSVATTWRDRVDRNDWSTPGGSVGFGIESALVTEIVIQVAGAALGEVLSAAAGRVRSGWRRWRGRRGDRPVAAPVRWSAEDEGRLREATQRHATALGLSAAQAGLLADALVGAVRSSGGQPAAPGSPTQPSVADDPSAPVGESS
jgi:hypothetical protein